MFDKISIKVIYRYLIITSENFKKSLIVIILVNNNNNDNNNNSNCYYRNNNDNNDTKIYQLLIFNYKAVHIMM